MEHGPAKADEKKTSGPVARCNQDSEEYSAEKRPRKRASGPVYDGGGNQNTSFSEAWHGADQREAGQEAGLGKGTSNVNLQAAGREKWKRQQKGRKKGGKKKENCNW